MPEPLPHVVYADHPLYTCSQDSQETMKELIEEHNLNRGSGGGLFAFHP